MLAVNLLFSVLLQFAFGHTAASGLDSIGCYKNTIVNSGFIGHVDTYTGGTVSGGDNTPENNKYCADLLAGGYKTGSSFLGNVSPLASINRESTNPQTICGIVVRDKASATLTGWWYAPMDGTYEFTLSGLSAAQVSIDDYSCCKAEVTGMHLYTCTSSETKPRTQTYTGTFRGGVYYPITVVYVRALKALSFSASVTLPDGSKVKDIGSMVFQLTQEKQVCHSASSAWSETSTATAAPSQSATSSSSASTSQSAASSYSVSTSKSAAWSSQYPSSTRVSSSTSVASSSSSSSALPSSSSSSSVLTSSSSSLQELPSSSQPVPTSSMLPTSVTQSNSTLITVATRTSTTTSTAHNGITTVLTLTSMLTSTFTYCPECESNATETQTVSIPTTTETATVVVTSTNDAGQTVILTKTITTTYCPGPESSNAGQTMSEISTSSALSNSVGNTKTVDNEVTSTICTTCTGSGNGSEAESGPASESEFNSVSEPAFTPQTEPENEPAFTFDSKPAYTYESGIDFDTASGDDFTTVTENAYKTVSKIAFSTVSGNGFISASGNAFSSVYGNGSSSALPTAAVSTYDGSGSAMGMISSLAVLPLFALLI